MIKCYRAIFVALFLFLGIRQSFAMQQQDILLQDFIKMGDNELFSYYQNAQNDNEKIYFVAISLMKGLKPAANPYKALVFLNMRALLQVFNIYSSVQAQFLNEHKHNHEIFLQKCSKLQVLMVNIFDITSFDPTYPTFNYRKTGLLEEALKKVGFTMFDKINHQQSSQSSSVSQDDDQSDNLKDDSLDDDNSDDESASQQPSSNFSLFEKIQEHSYMIGSAAMIIVVAASYGFYVLHQYSKKPIQENIINDNDEDVHDDIDNVLNDQDVSQNRIISSI